METRAWHIGTFLIGTQEFGFDVASVIEVVNFPTAISPVPLTPKYVEGVFNLRGSIIPVVSIAKLLGLEGTPGNSQRKLAIVTNGTERVGFVFDGAKEILRLKAEEVSVVHHERSPGTIIAAVAALGNGARIVEILDVNALFEIEHLPKMIEKKPHRAAQSGEERIRQCITFRIGVLVLGLDIAAVVEVVHVGEIVETVLITKSCLGLMNRRGENIPIIHLARLISDDYAEPDLSTSKVVIVKSGEVRVGLLIDSIEGTENFRELDLLALPVVQGQENILFDGLLETGKKPCVLLLHTTNLVNHPKLKAVGKGYSNIYRSEGKQAAATRSRRKYFLLFRLEERFAIALEDLQEIIATPADLMHPPGLGSAIVGLHNLRGEIITILNVQEIYGTGPSAENCPRILIFRSGENRFGIPVACVESILTVDESTRIPIPKILSGQRTAELENDVKEIVEFQDYGSSERIALVVIEFSRLFQRLLGAKPLPPESVAQKADEAA